ncbi:hypothetical protein WOLCODRAFT_150339 [Wolfiporia cocos MD-104 SS10]|uniref:Uncharacterized protein n=1 Tax=Wolfiporia cocos (strain MD-104) TaxID=742152 RepID=A0A2H3JDM4_WOLCO|nr:hypothetical protein WOLCODRAFT_150339 [Wolfiporia cocos MD-104 SS10]
MHIKLKPHWYKVVPTGATTPSSTIHHGHGVAPSCVTTTVASGHTAHALGHALTANGHHGAPSQDANSGALPGKVACPWSGASLNRPHRHTSNGRQLRRITMMMARPRERRLPYNPSEHHAHALGNEHPQPTATPAIPNRTPPPACCHVGGVPLERRLPKPSATASALRYTRARPPATTAYPNRSPPPPLRRPRLARMERRLPKPSTTTYLPRTSTPARYLESNGRQLRCVTMTMARPRERRLPTTVHHGSGIALPPSSSRRRPLHTASPWGRVYSLQPTGAAPPTTQNTRPPPPPYNRPQHLRNQPEPPRSTKPEQAAPEEPPPPYLERYGHGGALVHPPKDAKTGDPEQEPRPTKPPALNQPTTATDTQDPSSEGKTTILGVGPIIPRSAPLDKYKDTA